MKSVTFAVLGTFTVLLLGTGFLAYFFHESPSPAVTTSATASPAPTQTQTQPDTPFIGELFGPDVAGPSVAGASWQATAAKIALRFSLAAFLAAVLAFRPRRGVCRSRPSAHGRAVPDCRHCRASL